LTGGLVLAAGAGERFGGPKQLAQLDGRPLLEHALIAVESLEHVVVVLGAHADEVLAAVPLHGAEPVVCPDWAEGQAASLRAGIAALPADCDAAVVVLGDQPRIAPEAVARVIAARGDGALAVRATYGGVPGHPIVLERALFGRVGQLRGDEGARGLLREVSVRSVPCDGLGSPVDVDKPSDLDVLGSPNSWSSAPHRGSPPPRSSPSSSS
jgi:CTP:molybdopterin cytidylyltransferase MocA